MNLNISYNWLKSHVKTDLSPQEFAKKISLVGPSVDHIKEVKPNFSKVVVGQILKIENHPDADKLHVCEVNVGKEKLQIVCGAPNIEVGQKVPVVLVGGKVGDFDIKPAKLRGVESFGMMCSQKELGLSDDHAGIFILPQDTKMGEPLEKVMPIEDTILDVEVTSNRPDAMSVIGLAREASAALKAKFLYTAAKPNLKLKGDSKKLTVKITEPKLCPRYEAIIMTDIKVGPSPLWMQQRLIASGLRPINNLVDITNYILLEFGQPMHVFDYDKLAGNEINVRKAKKGEKILALDGKEYELSNNQLVIADKANPVAVAGVMGGELSAATSETKTIVFECANFNPVSVRKTSRALNLRSDSSALYEKGISPENTYGALLRAIELTQEIAGGKVASKIIDEKKYKFKEKQIKLSLEKVNSVLGITLKATEVKSLLEALGFAVAKGKTNFKVSVPWWRDSDILGAHDLIEEIARMYGYQNLPTKIMAGDLPPIKNSAEFYWEDRLKDLLVGFGLTEIYPYSFISEKMISNCGLNLADHIKIANPLSSDFEYMRINLAPSALQIISENQGFYPNGKLFDLNKTYLPLGKNDLADEKLSLLIACYSRNRNEVLHDLKGLIAGLLEKLNIGTAEFKTIPSVAYYSADLALISSEGKQLGTIGIIADKTLSNFGIKRQVAVAELDFVDLISLAKTAPTYVPIPKYPNIELDLSMEIDSNISYAEVVRIATTVDADIIERVEFLSVYEGEKLPQGKKALAIRLSYRSKDKTLELSEAQAVHEKVVAKLKKEYNISVR